MKRLIDITLIVVVVLFSATCPYSQTRPRRVTQPNNTLAETSRSRTVEAPVEQREAPIEQREAPVERPQKHHNWGRILGTAAIIGVSAATASAHGGMCTPSRGVLGPR
ncbi:MAG TPA: hypothetical protein VE961_02355 [Pyrinomonadaceae bacterium]|nr:hypothetical protein [Pyrinomonadaceae bacterium]